MTSGFMEPFRDEVQRFIPAAFLQFAVLAHQRARESIRMINETETEATLDAQAA